MADLTRIVEVVMNGAKGAPVTTPAQFVLQISRPIFLLIVTGLYLSGGAADVTVYVCLGLLVVLSLIGVLAGKSWEGTAAPQHAQRGKKSIKP